MPERAATQPIRERRRWLRRLGYSVYLLVAVLLSTEVLLRWFDPIGMSYVYETRRYAEEMMVPDDRFAYIHKPGLVATAQGVGISINSHGLRGPEFPADKSPGKTRLMILGDSVVFGWGVEEDATFPRRLQVEMDRLGIPVEIMAAGVGSWNTRTQYEWFRHLGMDFAPDVLLLVIVENDTDPKHEGYTAISKAKLLPDAGDSSLFETFDAVWRFASRLSYLAAHLRYYWARHLLTRQDKLMDEHSPQWRDAQMALDGLIDLCREHGIELVVYLYGSEKMVRSDPSLALYQEHLASRGLRPLTIPEVVEQVRFHNSVVDPHLNAQGHAILAAAMLETLAPRLAARRREIAPGDQSRIEASETCVSGQNTAACR